MTRLSRDRLLGYGAGSVGTGVFSAVPGLLLGFTALPALLMLISLPFVAWYGRLAPTKNPTKETV
jgi:hypothetical protein